MTVLIWGIKESLRQYISSIPDGKIEITEGASITGDGLFSFPEDDAEGAREDERVLRFRGTILFSGYRGMMSVTLCDPAVELTAGRAALSVARPHLSGARLVLAVSESFEEKPADLESVTVIPGLALTSAGAEIFEYNYPLGATLDTARIEKA